MAASNNLYKAFNFLTTLNNMGVSKEKIKEIIACKNKFRATQILKETELRYTHNMSLEALANIANQILLTDFGPLLD